MPLVFFDGMFVGGTMETISLMASKPYWDKLANEHGVLEPMETNVQLFFADEGDSEDVAKLCNDTNQRNLASFYKKIKKQNEKHSK